MIGLEVRKQRALKRRGDCDMLGGELSIRPLKFTRKCDIISRGTVKRHTFPLKFRAKCDMLAGETRFGEVLPGARQGAAKYDMLVSRLRGGVVSPSPDTERKTPHLSYHIGRHRAARPGLKLWRECGMLWGEGRIGGMGVPSPLVSGRHAEPFLHHDNTTLDGRMWGHAD